MALDPERLKSGPRVLILSDEAPQTGTAGGLLLHRLFSAYPPDRIRVVTHHIPPVGFPLPAVAYRKLPLRWQKLERSRFHRWKRSLRALGYVPQPTPEEIDGLTDGFRPDLVLCVMQHAAYYDAAHEYARSKGLPLVTLVHDVNEEFEPVFPWLSGAARRRDAAFYRYASRRLCISPEMERLCASLYGVPGTVLYPNRDPGLQARPLDLSAKLLHPPGLTLGFAGNLNFGYGEGILQMLPALRAAGARVIVYGRPPAGSAAPLLEADDICELRGFVPSAVAWEGLQRDCDAVWLPYPDLGGTMERLYRHHFPSKLPEYLALGMPVIVTGPAYATGLCWARQNLSSELCAGNIATLTELLHRLAAQPARRRHLAALGLQVGNRDFEPSAIVAAFHRHLADSVVQGPPSVGTASAAPEAATSRSG
ncbi:MAG TPA: glycosyltransferase [Opitutaceae bacterium]|jgi:glycosyltransferase involved in cell wall biosynthesis